MRYRWILEDAQQFIYDYVNLEKKLLCEKYNKTFPQLVSKARYFGIQRAKREHRLLTDLQHTEVKEAFISGKPCKEIAAIFDVNISVIYNVLKRQNIKIPKIKYTFNYNFFDEIDSEEKAYFLGLLYADGYIDTDRGATNISLIHTDVGILEKFKKVIQYNGNIQTVIINKTNLKNCIVRPQKRLVFRDKHMTDTLANAGCVQKKSLVLKFPELHILPKSLYNHFIRGYFDGDGCISFCGNKPDFQILGTKEFLTYVQNVLVENTGLNFTKIVQRGNFFVLRYSGRINCLKLRDYIYNDATIYLDRKHIKFFAFSDSYTQIGRNKSLTHAERFNSRIKRTPKNAYRNTDSVENIYS